MTERTFGDIASKGEFDEWAPENIAPMVAFLGTDAAAEITGQVFYVYGGTVYLFEGWTYDTVINKSARWTVEELVDQVPTLFKEAPTKYAPPTSSLQASLRD
jgi:hypothetical protein